MPITAIAAPVLTIVIPTFNERGNVEELVRRIDQALACRHWEVIFVDDNSPDETTAAVRAYAQRDSRVRCMRRIGRRGLASACIEGMLASSAPFVACMDADLQHDPALLPRMLDALENESAEIVVASRYTAGGSTEAWQRDRLAMSRFATMLANGITRQKISDPMSGYFMMRRDRFESLAPRLSSLGFKILLDVLASAQPPLRTLELPLVFGERYSGESKLTTNVAWEFVLLLADKLVGRFVPVRFLSFTLVGSLGIGVHFAVLTALLTVAHWSFMSAQAAATAVAMVCNYALNNLLTYVDRPRRGWQWFAGLISFTVICSVGAVANVGVSSYLFEHDSRWQFAALAGILVGAVWNFAVSNVYTWRKR
jgi:dolichol-phosphate mannosyltransferase